MMEEKRMMTQLEKAMMSPKTQLAKEVLDLRREVERLKTTLTEQRTYVDDLKAIVTVDVTAKSIIHDLELKLANEQAKGLRHVNSLCECIDYWKSIALAETKGGYTNGDETVKGC